MTRRLLLSLAAILLLGCHPSAGTWSDDPKNWDRAFKQSRPPEGITVVRSWYMRTPHFTAEYAWFFELQLSDEVKKGLAASPELKRVDTARPDQLWSRVYGERPAWFKPEPLADYDVFEFSDEPGFFILLHKSSSRAFWTRQQL